MSALYLATQGRLLATQVIQILFASHLFLNYGYEIAPVDGPSMLPTIYQRDDFVLIEKWTPLSQRGFKVGDIVHGRHPYGNHPVCKRLVGKVPPRQSQINGREKISFAWIH
jgi:signal peptidase I